MAVPTPALQRARAAYADDRWGEARAAFLEARAEAPLSGADAGALADAAWWEGDADAAMDGFEESFQLLCGGDGADRRRAALLAIDLGFLWMLRGEEAIGSGWLHRAARLLADEPPCVEHGYLRSIAIDEALAQGDLDGAVAVAREVIATAEAHGDETLLAMALVGEGIATTRGGDVQRGLAVLDEAMLPVVAGRVRPAIAGNIYCQLMGICVDLADLRRAQQWTDATARWCEGFSSAVMFQGVCRVHRAQLLQVRGEWSVAEEEIARACDDLASLNVHAVGLALYELAEVRRQQGAQEAAEQAYADAHRHGRSPMPGLALVWIATGRAQPAVQALRDELASASDPLARCGPLEALVEACLAVGDTDRAAEAADELAGVASTYASPGLQAAAATARGRVQLAAGDPRATEALDDARRRWQELGARWREACVRLLAAEAHDRAGHAAIAAQERSTAHQLLDELGAPPPAAPPPPARDVPGGLTPREVEVLGEVARGRTNREVAAALSVSERTVARHLANIFVKLDVSSRTAAAAIAHEHGLLRR